MKWKRIEENENHKIEITINNQKIKKAHRNTQIKLK